jgi:hypothetical protein
MAPLLNLCFVVAAGLFLLAPGQASAQQNIGSTAIAHNDVERELAGQSGALGSGDPVYRDEIVRTGTDSIAKLAFLDSTALAVGPISRVVLDRFVYDPSSTSQAMAVNLTKGVFRFTTGLLDKRAYSITTPLASIGVRGTVLDIAVNPRKTRVTLVEGQAVVCARKGGACVTLNKTGQTASVTATANGPRAAITSDAVQFASLCGADAALCSGAGGPDFADSGGGGGALCGR